MSEPLSVAYMPESDVADALSLASTFLPGFVEPGTIAGEPAYERSYVWGVDHRFNVTNAYAVSEYTLVNNGVRVLGATYANHRMSQRKLTIQRFAVNTDTGRFAISSQRMDKVVMAAAYEPTADSPADTPPVTSASPHRPATAGWKDFVAVLQLTDRLHRGSYPTFLNLLGIVRLRAPTSANLKH